jgi:hypothetical protein
VARTQAAFYRDERGAKPVDAFIEALPRKHAAKIDDYIEEHLNGRSPDAPPPEYPISSQIDGELREPGFGSPKPGTGSCTNARTTWWSYCTPSRRTPARSPPPTSSSPTGAWRDFKAHGRRQAQTPARCRPGRTAHATFPPLTELIGCFADERGVRVPGA